MNNQNEADIKVKVQDSLDQLEDRYSPLVLKQVKSVINDMIDHNKTTKEALKITPALMDSLYQQGYKYFKGGKYKDALIIFNFLNALEITYTYSFASAACYQYLKEYENAIANYLFCTRIDLMNPIPYYHMQDCFIKLNNPAAALQAVIHVLTFTKDKPEYDIIREKALLQFEKIKEMVKEKYS